LLSRLCGNETGGPGISGVNTARSEGRTHRLPLQEYEMTVIQLQIEITENLNEHDQEKLQAILEQQCEQTVFGYMHTRQFRQVIKAESNSQLEI